MGSNICGLNHLVHKSPKTLANQYFDRGICIGSSTSIFEFMKPKCSSLWDTKKNKKRQLSPRPQPPEKLTLQEWILNSPSLNRIYPSFEESVEATAYKLQPRERFSLERMKMEVDDDEELEEDADIMSCKSQSGKRKKKVSFRLPEVADIFVLDSEDGYYFSK